MALILPGQRLMPNMDKETLSALGSELNRAIDDQERESAPTFRAISVWWRWYHAQPKQKVKNFPFANSSNVVVPLIGITCDALTSRLLSQVTAGAPTYWSTRTENEANVKLARNMARYVNWQADGNDFSFKQVLADSLPEMHVTGQSVLALHYRRDVRPFFMGRETAKGLKLSRVPITFSRGPFVEHVPREHILWDTRLRIGDAPLVTRRREYRWTELRDIAKLDDAWDAKAVKEIRAHPGVDTGTEADRISAMKDDLALRDSDRSLDVETHDIRELHVDWSMLGNRFEVPGQEEWAGEQVSLVVHLHRKTGTILRLVGQPYLLPYKPFINLKWRHGNHGVAKSLEQMQSMQTTLVNQMFDAQTRANAIWAITRNPKHLRQPFDPSRPLLVDSMDEFAPINMGNSIQPDLAGLTAIQTMAERWMGHSDPLLGRETRSGGHPAPATSTLALLEQVNMMSAGTDMILQEELGRLGEAIAILDQQFENNEGGKLQQVLGVQDAQAVGEYLFPEEPIPGTYFFDVVALSRTDNPDARMRRTLMTAQAYQNYAALALQGMQAIESPQVGPKVKATWVKILDSYGELLTEFLDASNLDDTERFVVQLDQLAIDARGAFQQFTAEAQQQAQQQQGAPGGGGASPGGVGAISGAGSVVGPGGGAPGGAGRPSAGIGLLQ